MRTIAKKRKVRVLGEDYAAKTSERAARESRSGIELTYTDDLDNAKPSLLLVGPGGVGKTHVAGTAPSPLFLNTDKGTLTVAHRHFPKIDFKPGDDVYKQMLDIALGIDSGDPPFDKVNPETVVFDDFSRFCTLMEMEIIDSPPDGKPRDETLFIGDYNLMKTRVVSVLNLFKRINKYVIGISGLTYEKDEFTGELLQNCDMTGKKLGPILPHYFDIVLLLSRDKDGRFLARTRPTRMFHHVKFRRPGGIDVESVPEEIENPTFQKIMDLLKVKGKK